MKNLEEFLKNEAKSFLDQDFGIEPLVQYSEDVNNDAIDGDAWLENKTSYIWKVGVLAVIDGNKCDWVRVYIGHQREINADFEFIGTLSWRDGENDDIARVLKRYLRTLKYIHPVFEDY